MSQQVRSMYVSISQVYASNDFQNVSYHILAHASSEPHYQKQLLRKTIFTVEEPSKQLLVQGSNRKTPETSMKYVFKVNNKDTIMTSMTLFWSLYR